MCSEYIKKNLTEIKNNIKDAIAKSSRTEKDVLLLAVTKTVDIHSIQKALDLGITDIGENKVQELLTKYDELKANWHFIGHLQTNKVKSIVGKVDLIHSVDNLNLAMEINKRALQNSITQDILVEVNLAKEDTKFGQSYENTHEFIKNLWKMRGINVKGLMTVAPFVDEGEKNRILFRNMRQLLVDINADCVDNTPMTILSMGMSSDYKVAIEEGATIVRIGTGIFGSR